MTIKNELDKLTEKDIYSLLLFALYKASSSEQFSTLSQLSFTVVVRKSANGLKSQA